MTPNQEGDLDVRTPRPSPWRLLAVPALAGLFAFGVALALPSPPSAPPGLLAGQACSGTEVVLPPGHPPIDGLTAMPFGSGARLPPGHPPIGAPGARRAAPALLPTFQQPEIIDI